MYLTTVLLEKVDEELNRAIESGIIFPNQDTKTRAKKLKQEYDWDITDGLKIWSFGPAPEEASGNYGANVLVDQTKAIQYLNEIKESVNSGLLWASRQGPLCEDLKVATCVASAERLGGAAAQLHAWDPRIRDRISFFALCIIC